MISGDSVTLANDKYGTKYLVVHVGKEKLKVQSPITKKYKWLKYKEILEVFPPEPELEDIEEEDEAQLNGEIPGEKFKIGDRVLVNFFTKKRPGIISGWDEDLLNYSVDLSGESPLLCTGFFGEDEICLDTANYSEESEGLAVLSGNGSQKSELLDTVTSMRERSQSTQVTSQMSPSLEISDISTQNGESTTCLLLDSPVQEHQTQENGKDLITQTLPSGGKDLESCIRQDLSTAFGNNPWEFSEEELGEFLWEPDFVGIDLKLQKFQLPNLEQDTTDGEYLLFPTLTANDGRNSRASGQNNLDKWFKDNGLTPNGSKLSAQAMSLMMGFPANWCDAISPCKPGNLELRRELREDSKRESCSVEVSRRHKQQSRLGESSTSKASEKNEGMAISLHQPWASLIARGRKKYETRSWKTKYRGKFLICAARLQPSKVSLQKFGLSEEDCPLGVAIAMCDLVDCIPITQELIDQQSEEELKAGEWKVGRYAWKLENVTPVEPKPTLGGQKLWRITPSDFVPLVKPEVESSGVELGKRRRGRAQKKASGSLSKLCKQVKDKVYYSFQYNYDVRDFSSKRGWKTVKVGVPRLKSHIIADAIREGLSIREVLSLLGRVPAGEIRE